jgi:hypothetical protein
MVKKKSKGVAKVEIDTKFDEEKLRKNYSKQAQWVFWGVIIVFAVFIISYFWVGPALRSFHYAGQRWTKSDMGGITIYHTDVQIYSTLYPLNVRNDPRTNNISVNMPFDFYHEAIITNDPALESCKGINSFANLELSKFLSNFYINVSGAIADKAYAGMFNVSFADCSFAVNKTVILMQKSDIPSILQDKNYPNCYIVNVGNCENIKTTERFIVAAVADMNKVKIN